MLHNSSRIKTNKAEGQELLYSYNCCYYSCAITMVYSYFRVSMGLGLSFCSLSLEAKLKNPWRSKLLVGKDPFAQLILVQIPILGRCFPSPVKDSRDLIVKKLK